jgi:hypothetical protein
MATEAGVMCWWQRCSAGLRHTMTLSIVWISVLGLTSRAGRSAAQFDGYAVTDEPRSVIVGDSMDGGALWDGRSPQAASYPPLQGYANYQHGPHCPGCRPCQGGPCWNWNTGIVNRILGEACPRWTAQIDALMLWQGNIQNAPLLIINDGTADPPVALNSNQLMPGVSVGPRAAIMLHIDRESSIEANYFNVGSINADRPFEAPFPEQLNWDNLAGIGQFGNIEDGVASVNGAIQSFELNWRQRHCGSPLTWLVGFRWVEWNQSLTISDGYDDGINAPGRDLLDARTANDLYGAQVGVDALLLDLWQQKIRFNGVAKAGIYGNSASATTLVDSDRSPDFPKSFTDTANLTGFFGELGITGAVRLTEHFFWRAGYNFFWISGVALPAQQLAAVNIGGPGVPEGEIVGGGSVFLHGVNTGLEFIW